MAITYDTSGNIIIVTGYTESTPCNFTDIYNADKASMLSLHARTGITGTDGAGVAVDRAERPADYVVLGGASNDLGIIIANWVGTTATIRITGTDRDGAAQTEDIVVTADGGYSTTKWFKTITHTQVTVFTATSFDYRLTQGQWGVSWELGTNQFQFDAELQIGDDATATYFSDSSKLIHLLDDFKVNTLVTCIIDGCSIFGLSSKYFIVTAPTTLCNLLSSTFYGINIQEDFNNIERCTFINSSLRYLRDTNLERINSVGGIGIDTRYSLGNVNDVYLQKNDPYGVRIYGDYGGKTFTFKNLKIRNAVITSFGTYVFGYNSVSNCYLVNPDVDVWNFTWEYAAHGTFYRQYEFDLKVVDKNNTPINGATVKIWDKNSTLIVDTTTGADGTIATQTISRGYYNAANGNTLQEYSPHLIKVEKAGYTTYEADFTLEEKTDWTIALQGVLKRNPAMTGGMV